MDDFGWKFWLIVVGLAGGAAVGGFLLFAAFGWALVTWGFFGTFAVISVILIALGYAHDRREQRRRKRLA